MQHGTVRATLPKGLESDDVTVEKAVELLDAKASRAKGKGGTKTKTAAKPKKKSTSRSKSSGDDG